MNLELKPRLFEMRALVKNIKDRKRKDNQKKKKKLDAVVSSFT